MRRLLISACVVSAIGCSSTLSGSDGAALVADLSSCGTSCRGDLGHSPGGGGDLAHVERSLTVTGDAASGYGGATLTGFQCFSDPSLGRFVSIAMPDKWPAGSVVHGVTQPTFNIYATAIEVIGGAQGTIYYESAPSAMFTVSGTSADVPATVLSGLSGAGGMLTVVGGWSCP